MARSARRGVDDLREPGGAHSEQCCATAAYSSIAQSGYFLLGIVALGRSDLATASLVVFAAAYAAMNLGAFAVVALVGRKLEDFSGVGRSAVWVGGAMVVFLLSLVWHSTARLVRREVASAGLRAAPFCELSWVASILAPKDQG